MPHHALLGCHLSLGSLKPSSHLWGTLRPPRSSVVAAWGWEGWGWEPDCSLEALQEQRDFYSFSTCSFSTAHLSWGEHPAPHLLAKDPHSHFGSQNTMHMHSFIQ